MFTKKSLERYRMQNAYYCPIYNSSTYHPKYPTIEYSSNLLCVTYNGNYEKSCLQRTLNCKRKKIYGEI
jgi:hypothetical protein